MPKVSPALVNFNAGEFSPLLDGRVDIQKYNAGCHLLDNFVPTVQGPLRRRPGTMFVKEVKNSFDRSWISRFSFSSTQSFILEWGDRVLRFYTDHGAVLEAPQIITAATKANPVVLTIVGHGFVADEEVFITGVGGMTELNGRFFHVHNYTDDTFQLYDIDGDPIDGTNYGAFTTGGTAARVYQIATPYPIADLTDSQGYFTLRFAGSADTQRVTNTLETYPPYKLSRHGNTSWTMAAMKHDGGPFQPVNSDETKVVYAGAETGVDILLTANTDIFKAGHVGALFYLEQTNIRDVTPWETGRDVNKGDRNRYNGVTYLCVKAGKTGSVPPTHLVGQAYDGTGANRVLWEYLDPGYGMLTITEVIAAPGPTPVDITGATVANPVVISADGHPYIDNEIVFISGVVGMLEINNRWFRVADAVAGVSFSLHDLAGATIDGTGYTTYTSDGEVDIRKCLARGDVVKRLPSEVVLSDNASSRWALGAWNDVDGYPAAVGFFRERLAFARDDNVWLSVAADFENFNAKTPGGEVTTDMAVSITVPTQETTEWLVEGTELVLGSSGGAFVAGQINTAQPLGPANIQVKPQSDYGSAPIQAVRVGGGAATDGSYVGGALLFMQLGGRKLREVKYEFFTNSYSASDLTTLAEHITHAPGRGNIIAMSFQREPDPVLWCVRADGYLIGFTYAPEQQVTGWHRHQISNMVVESIAIIPSPDGTQDEVWMQVQQTINHHIRRYIVYMMPHFLTGDDLKDAFYVDVGLTYDGGPATTISGLDHLEGMTVDVLGDGAAHPQCVVKNGSITLQRTISKAQVGLSSPCDMVTMRLEAGGATGTAQGKIKRITGVTFRFLNTLGGFFGPWSGASHPSPFLDQFQFRNENNIMDVHVPLFAADGAAEDMPHEDGTKLPWPDGYTTGARMEYYNNQPFPVTLVGIFPAMETQDGG